MHGRCALYFKMIRLLYTGLLWQLLVSCINMNDPTSQSDYIQYRDKFDNSLVKLFPDRLPNNMLGFGYYAPYEHVPTGLNLMTKYFSEKEYTDAKTRYLNQSKYQKTSTDKCLFLINDYEGMNQEKCEDFYPIPTEAIFERSLDGESKSILTDGKVFIIDFKSGDFLQDNDKHSKYELPENWTHGYSTGVTTNDNDRTIQIWLVVW